MAVQSEAAIAVQARAWPQRLNVIALLFLSVIILYMDHVNISVIAPVLIQELG